nr:hypothetical protein CFP56_53816 [Quercus suber]
MENLSAMWGKFSLSESEESKFQVQDDVLGEEFFLAARFFTSVIRVEGYEEECDHEDTSDRSDEVHHRDNTRLGDTHEEKDEQHEGGKEVSDRDTEFLGTTVVQRSDEEETEITEVNARNNEDIMIEINRKADFQAQLEEIDSELARYDDKGGLMHGELAGSQDLGLHGPKLVGLHGSPTTCGPNLNGNSNGHGASHTGQVRGRSTYKTRGLPKRDKVETQHEPILSKRPVCEFSEDEEADSDGERQRWRRKPFRFESMWVTDPSCKATVAEAWAGPRRGTPMSNVTTKIKNCKKRLKRWSKETFGNVKEQIRVVKERLWLAEAESLQSGDQGWLTETIPGLIVSPRPEENLHKVSELFLPNSRQWNLELIDDVFYPWEADAIKGIYISEDSSEDNLIWPLTPNGEYSVRSAYQLLSSTTMNSTASSSSSEGFKGVWKGIWKIRLQLSFLEDHAKVQ